MNRKIILIVPFLAIISGCASEAYVRTYVGGVEDGLLANDRKLQGDVQEITEIVNALKNKLDRLDVVGDEDMAIYTVGKNKNMRIAPLSE